MFPFDCRSVDWTVFCRNYSYGMSRWVLKDADIVEMSEDSVINASELSLTSGRLLEWDADHHTISFPGLIPDVSWVRTAPLSPTLLPPPSTAHTSNNNTLPPPSAGLHIIEKAWLHPVWHLWPPAGVDRVARGTQP